MQVFEWSFERFDKFDFNPSEFKIVNTNFYSKLNWKVWEFYD